MRLIIILGIVALATVANAGLPLLKEKGPQTKDLPPTGAGGPVVKPAEPETTAENNEPWYTRWAAYTKNVTTSWFNKIKSYFGKNEEETQREKRSLPLLKKTLEKPEEKQTATDEAEEPESTANADSSTPSWLDWNYYVNLYNNWRGKRSLPLLKKKLQRDQAVDETEHMLEGVQAPTNEEVAAWYNEMMARANRGKGTQNKKNQDRRRKRGIRK